jgi:glycosyltransferase involved in cell wall biosynthesis
MKPIRAVLVANAPAPYRVPALARVSRLGDIHLEVVYCTAPHIDPAIGVGDDGLRKHFLGGRYFALKRRFFHSSFEVVSLLRRMQPDVVVTSGFIPTFLYAFAWAHLTSRPHVVFVDGTLESEAALTAVHRAVRRVVFARTSAFVGASEGSSMLFRSYGVADDLIFKAPLAIDNARFHAAPNILRPVDLLFSGRLVEHKAPGFALQVAHGLASRLGRPVTIDFLGQGPLREALEQQAAALGPQVQAQFLGHLSQSELPSRYAQAKVFLFPSQFDPWGVVANEAAASGMPILVSPYAGAAGELVRDGVEGRVLPLSQDAWVEAAAALLQDEGLRQRLGRAAQIAVGAYTFEAAAEQLRLAIHLAARPTAARNA